MRRSAVLLGAAMLVPLSAAFPVLAAIIGLPFLFVIPGFLLVERVVPSLPLPGRLGLGVVTSIYVSAHLANVLSLLTGGFDDQSVLVTVAILIGGSAVLLALELPGLESPRPYTAGGARGAIFADVEAWTVAIAATVAVGLVLAVSVWHLTPAGWVSGGWNWSDFLVHVSISQSILNGNFPPQVPYFAGVPLTYHWFADLQSAIVATLTDVSVIPVDVFANALMGGVLALLVWALAERLTGNRRVAAIGALLAVFGGGLGWIRLPIDLLTGHGALVPLITSTPYDNTWAPGWPYFAIASVFGTGLLTHRATALGLPGLVAVVLLAYVSIGRRPAGVLLAGVLAALLAPFDFFVFPATYLIVIVLALAQRAWRQPTFGRDALLFFSPIVLAAPFVVGPALLQQGSGAFHPVLGWASAPLADGPLAVAFFYLTNLGLPFLLGIVAAVRRDTPNRLFLVAWLIALFAVPNLIVVSVVSFDMNKYFQMMWIAAAVLAAWAIRRLPWPAIAGVVGLSAISPLLIGVWFATSSTVAMSNAQAEAATWIATNTPERAVFVTDAFINSPVDLAGRLRVTTYGPYAANLGYNPDQRAMDVHHVYCDGDAAAAQIMRRYGATYVLSSGGLLDCSGSQPTDFASSPLFDTVYAQDGVQIWSLRAS
jgi:hypothetical protein